MKEKDKADELLKLQSLISKTTEAPMKSNVPGQSTKGKCAYCGEFRPLTRDHFYPQNKIGRLRETNNALWELIAFNNSNIVMACKRCNDLKGGRAPSEFLRVMPSSWQEGKQFVREKLAEMEHLGLPSYIVYGERKSVMAKVTEPHATRDWTAPLNRALQAFVKAGQAKPNGKFTHVFIGSAHGVVDRIEELGATSKPIVERLVILGVIEYQGKEEKWQGKAIWYIRNGHISADDAARADYLYRHGRETKKSVKEPAPMSIPAPVPAFKAEKVDTAGQFEQLNKEITALEDRVTQAETDRNQATVERDELYGRVVELEEKLAAATVAGSDAEKVARLESMISTLLAGGEMAQMLQEAAKLGRMT